MRRILAVFATALAVMAATLAPASAGNNITDPWWAMIVYDQSHQPTVHVGSEPVMATWRSVETVKDTYDFTATDAAINALRGQGKQVMINLWGTPQFWASKPTQTSFGGLGAASTPNMTAWKNYVTAVVTRYGNNVTYMPWNEPCVSGFWTGTKAQMVQIVQIAYTTIKAVAPTAQVVAPACPIRLSAQRTYIKYLYGTSFAGKKLGGWIDVAAVNPYPLATQGPESALSNYKWFKSMIAGKGIKKPIWVTEINYGIKGINDSADYSDATQQAYVIRTQALFAGSGTQRMTWWSWDSLWQGVHLTPDKDWVNLTPAGRSWEVGYSWLNNTSVNPCVKNSAGVWSCVAIGGGETRRIYWRTSGTSSVAAAVGAFSREDVNGIATPTVAGQKFTVSTSPVMVRSH